MDTDERGLNSITGRIIGCSDTGANALGRGSMEKVYGSAPAHELRCQGLAVETQRTLEVRYRNIVVGESRPSTDRSARRLNYRKAIGLRLCRRINFGAAMIPSKRIAGPFHPCSTESPCGSE